VASQAASSEASPLLDACASRGGTPDESFGWERAQTHLARRLAGRVAAGAEELVLDDADLAAMDAHADVRSPEAMAAMFLRSPAARR